MVDTKTVQRYLDLLEKTFETLHQPIGQGALVSLAPERLPITADVEAVPVGML